MRTETKSQIIKMIGKNGGCRPVDLAKKLVISSQALHRHLAQLVKNGLIKKVGVAPTTCYQLESKRPASVQSREILSEVGNILGSHPAVMLVTLFGSWAREEAGLNSDIDFLVWLNPRESFNRHDIWNYWDRQSRHLNWSQKVSIVTRKLTSDLSIDTLLLDMPEEHRVAFDRKKFFEVLKNAVIQWRARNGSLKLGSFGGKHGWKYSTKVDRLDQINFSLELKDVP